MIAYELVCERDTPARYFKNFKRDWLNHRGWKFEAHEHCGRLYVYMEGEEDDRIEIGLQVLAQRTNGTYRKIESYNQRVQQMRAGIMPLREALKWASHRPYEIPLVNGEFEFIATYTPEVCDD